MRILYTLLLLIIVSPVFAQASFEGKIKYAITTYEKAGNGEMTIYFGKPGIRIEMIETNSPSKAQNVIIINFDSGRIFTLQPSKTYEESPLKRNAKPVVPVSREIAGFRTTPVSPEETPRDLAGLIGSSILYAAADLTYSIPEVYLNNPQLIMVNNGRIVLGGDFFFPEKSGSDWPLDRSKDSTSEKQKLFEVVANEVVAQPLDGNLFTIPSDYTKETFDYTADPYKDSLDRVSELRKKPITKSKKKSSQKSSTSTKQNATRRKND